MVDLPACDSSEIPHLLVIVVRVHSSIFSFTSRAVIEEAVFKTFVFMWKGNIKVESEFR